MAAIKRIFRYVLVYGAIASVSAAAALLAYSVWRAATNPPRHQSANVEMFKEGQWAFQYDPVFGAVPVPGGHGKSSANGVVYDYFYGPYGNRIRSPDEPTDPAAQIVMLGCSQAWGQGVANDHVASTVLARMMGWNAINLAVPGTSTIYAALRLERFPELRPRAIVYLLFEDHLYRNLRRCAPVDNPLCVQLPRAGQGRDGRWRVRTPSYLIENMFGDVYVLMRRWYLEQYEGSGRTTFGMDVFWTLMRVYGRLNRAIFDNRELASPEERSRVIGAVDFALGRIARYAEERRAKLIVVYLPLYSYPAPLVPIADDLRAVITSHGALLVDMSAPFNAMLGKESKDHGTYLFAIPNDNHLNAFGHRLVAEEVYRALRRGSASNRNGP